MKMNKYISGKIKLRSISGLSTNRHRYLSLDQAEPNLGYPGEKTLPISENYYKLVTIDGGDTYDRYWITNPPASFSSGGISIYDEGTLVGTEGAVSKIDFRGLFVEAESTGSIGTVRFGPPQGNNGKVIFIENNQLSYSNNLLFDPNAGILTVRDQLNVGTSGTIFTVKNGFVGINTVNPTQELHVNGDLRITGTIYDSNNSPGLPGYLLVKNESGGITWQNSIVSSAGGNYQSVQFHNLNGLIDGATDFVYNEVNGRVGIGTTIPTDKLDVIGDVTIDGNITANSLISNGTVTVNNLDANQIFDSNDSLGETGQYLTPTGTGVSWSNLSTAIDSQWTAGIGKTWSQDYTNISGSLLWVSATLGVDRIASGLIQSNIAGLYAVALVDGEEVARVRDNGTANADFVFLNAQFFVPNNSSYRIDIYDYTGNTPPIGVSTNIVTYAWSELSFFRTFSN